MSNEISQTAQFDYTELNTVVDWIRFTISQLQQENVYFGHGTDNVWDEKLVPGGRIAVNYTSTGGLQ